MAVEQNDVSNRATPRCDAHLPRVVNNCYNGRSLSAGIDQPHALQFLTFAIRSYDSWRYIRSTVVSDPEHGVTYADSQARYECPAIPRKPFGKIDYPRRASDDKPGTRIGGRSPDVGARAIERRGAGRTRSVSKEHKLTRTRWRGRLHKVSRRLDCPRILQTGGIQKLSGALAAGCGPAGEKCGAQSAFRHPTGRDPILPNDLGLDMKTPSDINCAPSEVRRSRSRSHDEHFCKHFEQTRFRYCQSRSTLTNTGTRRRTGRSGACTGRARAHQRRRRRGSA